MDSGLVERIATSLIRARMQSDPMACHFLVEKKDEKNVPPMQSEKHWTLENYITPGVVASEVFEGRGDNFCHVPIIMEPAAQILEQTANVTE